MNGGKANAFCYAKITINDGKSYILIKNTYWHDSCFGFSRYEKA
jgi:hypothetical protein